MCVRRCLILLWICVGCDCGAEPTSQACVTASECEGAMLCVDGRCVPPGTLDGGDNLDAQSPGSDSGPGPGPDLPPDVGVDAEVDSSCGGESVMFDYRPPNVLLVFDRSCSMRRRLDDVNQFGTGPDDGRTRWATGRDAALDLINRFGNRVFWGLMAYPNPRMGCGAAVTAEVLPAPDTAASIDAELRRNEIEPFGLCGLDNSDTTTQPRETPTSEALEAAAALIELRDPMRQNFVILVTDGGESCVDNSELMTIATTLADADISTAVIGFATGSDEQSLDAIAALGGFPNPAGPPSYFVAEDRADLDAVFEEVAARVVSCDLALSSTPPDPSMLFVNANDNPLDEDPSNGWTYDSDSNSLTLHGSACDDLRLGVITRLSVSFGCMPVACMPMAEVCNGLDDDCDDDVDEDCLL